MQTSNNTRKNNLGLTVKDLRAPASGERRSLGREQLFARRRSGVEGGSFGFHSSQMV